MTHEFHTCLVPFHFRTVQLQVLQTAFIKKGSLISVKTLVYITVSTAKSGDQEVVCDQFHSFKVFNKLMHFTLPDFGG